MTRILKDGLLNSLLQDHDGHDGGDGDPPLSSRAAT